MKNIFSVKKKLKKFLIDCLYALGILSFLHYKNRHRICILMLHGVMAENAKTTWNPLRGQLSPKELNRILNILSDDYEFITVDQSLAILNGELPCVKNALLITFDDGYRNNLDYALPICQKMGIKPVLFVATGHVDSGLPFWFDRLDYALQQNMGEVIELEYRQQSYIFDGTSRELLATSFKKFRDHCKNKFSDDIEMNGLFSALSEILESRSGKSLYDISANDEWSSIVTWEQLRHEVQKGTLDVASHTVNHWRLDCLSEEKISSQLMQSKLRIEQELAVDCQYFCYPNGNYNTKSVLLTKESGYVAAFSTDLGLCQSGDDLMTLKRFNFPANKTKSELLYLLNR